jgi:hypothetical protein
MLDTGLHSLAEKDRREILLALLEDQSVSVDAAVSSTDEPNQGSAVTVGLHHQHLPRLEDMGLIEWDREASAVERGPRFEEFRPLLETLDENAEQYAWDWP